MIHRPSAVLFDHDGVLAESEALHRGAWKLLLEELGIPYIDAELRALGGKTGPQIMAALLDHHRPGWSRADYDLDALALRKNDFYQDKLIHRLQPYPGVPEGLRWLRGHGIRIAVVSNAKGRELRAGLKQLGIESLVDLILSRDEAQPPKPDPAPYLLAASRLGVAPDRALVVEDSPPGLEAGLRAGIPTAAVATTFPAKALEAPVPGRPELRPVWIGPDMKALFGWIATLS